MTGDDSSWRDPSAGPRSGGAAAGGALGASALAGPLLDLALSCALMGAGVGWQNAHVPGYVLGSVVALALVRAPRRRTPTFALVQVLGLLLRGVLLAALVRAAGSPPLAALVVALPGSWVVALVGARLWVLTPTHPGAGASEDLAGRRVVAMIAYALALRLALGGVLELLHQEAYYWNYGQHLDLAYLDHPPLVGWIAWLTTWIGGHSELALRTGSLACWLIAAAYAYRLALVLGGRPVALRALLLMAVLPAFFGPGLFLMTEAPLMACWSGALFYLHGALIAERRGSWLGAGVCLGLGLLSKYTMVLLGGSAALFLLCDRQARRWLLRPEPYVALALTAVLFSPVVLWNATHDWASFRYQGPGRAADEYQFSLQDLVGAVLLLLTPPGLFAAAVAVTRRGARPTEVADPRGARSHRLLLTLTLAPLSVFLAVSLFRYVKLNWTAPIWLGLLPYLAALTIRPASAEADAGRPLVLRWWSATPAALLLVWGLVAYHLVLGVPGAPLPENVLGAGMDHVARRVEAIVERTELRTGERPLVVCTDASQTASWLAFYRARTARAGPDEGVRRAVDQTTGGHLFGWDSHMYRFWHPPELLRGRRVLLVSPVKTRYWHPPVVAASRYLGPIRSVGRRQEGRRAGQVHVRPARLHGEPPGGS